MSKRIVMVKKIMADGSPCKKCAEIEQRIIDGGYQQHISETLIADERDSESPGMKLAATHQVKLAPFFLLYNGDDCKVYTSWLRLEKEVLKGQVDQLDEAVDILEQNPDLDLL